LRNTIRCKLIILLAGVSFGVPAMTLNDINNIANAGATGLAVKAIDKHQPAYISGQQTEQIKIQNKWLDWERTRIAILKQTGNNSALIKRLQAHPAGLPGDFSRWAQTELATALLATQNNTQAREILRKLIWAPALQVDTPTSDEVIDSKTAATNVNDNTIEKTKQNKSKTQKDTNTAVEENNKKLTAPLKQQQDWLAVWRRMVIQSYLQSGMATEALTAITRYRQDYGEGQINDVILYARVLLINEQNTAAFHLLAKHARQPEAGTLYLLAQLRSKSRAPRKVLQAALRQMQGEWVKAELKTYLWAIVAEAAAASNDLLTQVQALESLLTDKNFKNLPEGLFNIHADILWKAYHDYALLMGNKAQYLIGDDAQWLKAAKEQKQALNGRSYAAFIVIRGQSEDIKSQAAEFMRLQLENDESGKRLLGVLFLDSDKFENYQSIPLSIRYLLAEQALQVQDILLASKLMASIKNAPTGTDSFMWSLRRARVLIMGGQSSAAEQALTDLLAQHEKLEIENYDRFIQVVFDLQTIGAHDESIKLFLGLLNRTEDTQRQRELYYWIADSFKASGRHAEAAQAYLQSAMLIEPDMMDPWAQTARYQAAKSLMTGKMYTDARVIYEHLLRVTEENSRRSVLKRELQQLKLMQHQ